jgi:hypothetical protein
MDTNPSTPLTFAEQILSHQNYKAEETRLENAFSNLEQYIKAEWTLAVLKKTDNPSFLYKDLSKACGFLPDELDTPSNLERLSVMLRSLGLRMHTLPEYTVFTRMKNSAESFGLTLDEDDEQEKGFTVSLDTQIEAKMEKVKIEKARIELGKLEKALEKVRFPSDLKSL